MAEVSESTKQRLAELYFTSRVLKFGQFTFKSGVESPLYVDTRMVQSHPETLHTVVNVFAELIDNISDSVLLTGVPEAATPLAAAVGYKMERPLVQLRKVVKSHGTKSSVEGDYQQGDQVVLIDDLIYNGNSKFEAIEQIEKAGLEVKKLVVILDWQQGGMGTVQKAGYEIEAGLTLTELINILAGLSKVTTEQKQEVLDFVEGNKGD